MRPSCPEGPWTRETEGGGGRHIIKMKLSRRFRIIWAQFKRSLQQVPPFLVVQSFQGFLGDPVKTQQQQML